MAADKNITELLDFIAAFSGDEITPTLAEKFKKSLSAASLNISKTGNIIELNYKAYGSTSKWQNIELTQNTLRYAYSHGNDIEHHTFLLKAEKYPILIAEASNVDSRDSLYSETNGTLQFIVFDTHELAEKAFYQRRYAAVSEQTMADMEKIATHMSMLSDQESFELFKDILKMDRMARIHDYMVNQQLFSVIDNDSKDSIGHLGF